MNVKPAVFHSVYQQEDVEEVLQLFNKDRDDRRAHGFYLGGAKCTIARDGFADIPPWVEARTMGGNTTGICLMESCKTIVAVAGPPNNSDSSLLHKACRKMAAYLLSVGL
ncbi:hypothetical protein GJAV_G00127690 [Gymnothorax javanicus]|nr:hypothetical protein GJAV_G00127690 [Gymnothorax javanicus]